MLLQVLDLNSDVHWFLVFSPGMRVPGDFFVQYYAPIK